MTTVYYSMIPSTLITCMVPHYSLLQYSPFIHTRLTSGDIQPALN